VGSLDGLSVAPAGWWNVARRDFTSYTGPLCRIQRTSDNAELDIGYAADGWLDTAAIAAHCAGTTGRVKTLYDQSGNARSLTNATHANQPIIYAAAAQIVLGTKPAMDFNGSTTYLDRADACGLTGATAFTAASVADWDTASGWVFHLGKLSYTGGGGMAVLGGISSATSMNTSYVTSSTTYGSLPASTLSSPHYALRMLAAGAQVGNATARVNGSAATETAEVSPANTISLLNERTLIGCANNGAFVTFFDGRQSAFGLWSSVLAGADLTAVEAACAGVIV
jgi:hypothetical protein